MGISILKQRIALVAAAFGMALALVFAMGVLAPAGSAAVPTAQAQTSQMALVYNGPDSIVNYLNAHKRPTVKTAAIAKGKLVLKGGKYGIINAQAAVTSMKKAKSFKLSKSCKFYKENYKNGSFSMQKISKATFAKTLKSLSKKRSGAKPKQMSAVGFVTDNKGVVTYAFYNTQKVA